jgi:hypothetical protein
MNATNMEPRKRFDGGNEWEKERLALAVRAAPRFERET